MDLIPVEKGGEYLEIHPHALSEHKKLGWHECKKREAAEPEVAKVKGKAKSAEQEAAKE